MRPPRRRARETTARIELLGALEMVKCAAAAAQAVVAVDVDRSQRAAQREAGVPRPAAVAAQIALARRESHHRGQQHLSLAKILLTELPYTMAAFAAGRSPSGARPWWRARPPA